MNILLKQIDKQLYGASFEIIEKNENIGTISLEGKLGSMEAYLNGKFNDVEFQFKYNSSSGKKFRIYDILEGNNKVGEIYQTRFKKNIFSSYDYVKCIYKDKEYNSYAIGLGDKGVNCIYLNDIQIAQIEKDGTIYNDLHNFDIYSKNKDDLYLALLISCYLYINSCYKSGVKVKESVAKNYSKTTNKDLLEKYDFEWKKKII